MLRSFCTKKMLLLVVSVFMLLMLNACSVALQHTPSHNLTALDKSKSTSIMVADIGDSRDGESPDRIGQGVSYWLPVSFYARDAAGQSLPVSHYIARSICEDLGKIGYDTKMANENSRSPIFEDQALKAAKDAGAEYLVMTKVTDGKTNFWGFIIIPFVQPVWTRIGINSQLIDVNNEKGVTPITTFNKKTEWYFAKITIFDAIFDAGIFGRNWHRTAWGETVISDALAEASQKISTEIQSKIQMRADKAN